MRNLLACLVRLRGTSRDRRARRVNARGHTDRDPDVMERIDAKLPQLTPVLQREPVSMSPAEVDVALLNCSAEEVARVTTGGSPPSDLLEPNPATSA